MGPDFVFGLWTKSFCTTRWRATIARTFERRRQRAFTCTGYSSMAAHGTGNEDKYVNLMLTMKMKNADLISFWNSWKKEKLWMPMCRMKLILEYLIWRGLSLRASARILMGETAFPFRFPFKPRIQTLFSIRPFLSLAFKRAIILSFDGDINHVTRDFHSSLHFPAIFALE